MESTSNITHLTPATLPPPVGYSHIVKVHGGTLVVLSGQMARDAEGAVVGQDNFLTQLQQVFANLDTAIREAGGSFSDIIKLNYFCVDSVSREEQTQVVQVRDQYINTNVPPASTFVRVAGLARPEWLIEIEALAVISGDRTCC